MTNDTENRLEALLRRVIPIVDGLADKLRILLVLLIALLIWFGVYLSVINDWSWKPTAMILFLAAIPLLILGRLYASLRDVQALPDTLDEVGDDVRLGWSQVSSGKPGAFNLVRQAKNLFEIRGLLGSADELIGNYVSFGVLMNPLFLILAVLALLFTLLLTLIGLGTLVSTIF